MGSPSIQCRRQPCRTLHGKANLKDWRRAGRARAWPFVDALGLRLLIPAGMSAQVSEFTHLHVHSQYSLLDGAIRLKDLFPKLASLGMNTVALTDHGNMFGAVDFYKKAKAAGIKPIFGSETYICNDRTDRTSRRNYHLILLAKSEVGYKNLQYLNSMAYMEGFYYHPRIDKKLLKDRSEGLIGLSACLGGEIAQTLLNQGYEQAKLQAQEYASLFGDGD